jgi:putative flippase GtrA
MTSPDSLLAARSPLLTAGRTAQVEIVVPVRNEERDLAPSVRRLVAYLRASFPRQAGVPLRATVTIADNGSTDRTWPAARALAQEFCEVEAVRLAEAGRGRALRAVWSASGADVLAYMDVDLSTGLNALLPLLAPLLSGHSDLAIGTRLARGARVVRGPRRELISRCYNALLHATLGTGVSDAQCGFKAIRADRARELLPRVRDNGWFFDSELLVLAERAGLRIHEVPVDWTDDPDSRVDVLATALADLRGIARLARDGTARDGTARDGTARDGTARDSTARGGAARDGPGLPRQLGRFVLVGAASTVAYTVLYLALRGAMPAQAANAVSLLVTAVANTAANRRFTFGIRGRRSLARQQGQGMLAFAAGLAVTATALAALHAGQPHPGRAAEVAVGTSANVLATGLRFLLYRHWIFRTRATKGTTT